MVCSDVSCNQQALIPKDSNAYTPKLGLASGRIGRNGKQADDPLNKKAYL